jgi:hypothetical protein
MQQDLFVDNPRMQRYREAYMMMSEFYRPMAPSDGFGSIQLTKEQCADKARLWVEATNYAITFDKEEDTREFHIGCSNFNTNRAFIFTIEAARLLAGGDADHLAKKLLKMALNELASHTHRGVMQK